MKTPLTLIQLKRLMLNVFFLFLISNALFSQSSHDYNKAIGVTTHFGFVIPHYTYLNHLNQGHVNVLEVSYQSKLSGKEPWHDSYKNIIRGVSLIYLGMGNDEVLGNGAGALAFFETPIIQKKIQWKFKAGFGLGYLSKRFDRAINNKNLVIGSHFNSLIYMNSTVQVPVTSRVTITSGLSLIHLSNGSFKIPNLGINISSVNVGATYSFGNSIPSEVFVTKNEKKANEFSIVVQVGGKEIEPIGGDKYLISEITLKYDHFISERIKLIGGTDFSYNASIKPTLFAEKREVVNNSYNFRNGIFSGFGVVMGRTEFGLQVGTYLFNKYKRMGGIYDKVYFNYDINRVIYLHLSMKAHLAVADYFGLGVGYKFVK